MLQRISFIPLIYVAAVVETSTVLPEAARFHALWLAAALLAWNLKPTEAVAWGGVLGLVAGALSSSQLAVEMILVATVTWAAASFRSRLELKSLLAWCLFCATTVAGLTGVSLALAGNAAVDRAVMEAVAPTLIAKIIVTTLVGVILVGLGRATRAAFARPSGPSYQSAW